MVKLVFMGFVCSLAHCEDDLVLEDKGLHSLKDPPEDDQDGQVLHPGKLDQLPECRVVGAGGVKETLGNEAEVTTTMSRHCTVPPSS